MLLVAAWVANKLRWVVPAVVVVAPSPLIFTAIQVLHLFKPIISPACFEYIDESIWSGFQRTVLFIYSNINGTQISYSGDYEEFFSSNENALYICNHQTAVDWVIVDMLSVRQNLMGHIRFMHKDELKYIPFFGLYFWQHSCINVGRYGAFNERKTINQLNHLKDQNIPSWLTIFPEGTRYNPANTTTIKKSEQFAQNNGLTILRHMLTPRSRGTFLALQQLHGYLDAVYDITIGYESTRQWSEDIRGYKKVTAPGMLAFAYTYSPKLHINIRRIPMREVPFDSEDQVMRWLHTCFERKDQLMERFISVGQFDESVCSFEVVSRWSDTLPYTIFNAGLTICCLAFPTGRYVYVGSTFIGSVLGMVWMKFH